MIKTEKRLLRLIWNEMGLGGYNADIKNRTVIAKKVRKALEFGMKNTRPEQREDMFDAIAELFLSHIDDMKEYYIPALSPSSCGTDFAGPPERSIKQFLTIKEIFQKVFRSNFEDIDRIIVGDAEIKSLGQRIIVSIMRIADILRAS